jgi:3-oxoacyl-[acyl-carrier protein] reductase
MLEAAIKSSAEKGPLKCHATPKDVAHVALFLASDEAAYLNGIEIPVDGGKIARF